MNCSAMSSVKITYESGSQEDWHDVITFMTAVADAEGVDLVEVEVAESDVECGFASVYEKKIYLYSKSYGVALHELAHIETMEGHTYDWAVAFAYLCKKYLPEPEYLEEMYKAERRYKPFKGLVQFLASRDSLDEETRWAWGKTR